MNCGACKHWDLSHTLGQYGYGRCQAQTNPLLRAGHSTAAQCVCRISRFVPATAETMREREQRTA